MNIDEKTQLLRKINRPTGCDRESFSLGIIYAMWAVDKIDEIKEILKNKKYNCPELEAIENALNEDDSNDGNGRA